MRYDTIWRNKFLTINCKTIQEMAEKLEAASATLRQMAADGMILEGGQEDDYATLVTHDPKVAEKWGILDDENTVM
jgi:hypothetical protein